MRIADDTEAIGRRYRELFRPRSGQPSPPKPEPETKSAAVTMCPCGRPVSDCFFCVGSVINRPPAIDTKVALSLVPTVVRASTQTTAISAAINPYPLRRRRVRPVVEVCPHNRAGSIRPRLPPPAPPEEQQVEEIPAAPMASSPFTIILGGSGVE